MDPAKQLRIERKRNGLLMKGVCGEMADACEAVRQAQRGSEPVAVERVLMFAEDLRGLMVEHEGLMRAMLAPPEMPASEPTEVEGD